jgi:hypothetical protein
VHLKEKIKMDMEVGICISGRFVIRIGFFNYSKIEFLNFNGHFKFKFLSTVEQRHLYLKSSNCF